MRDLFLSFTIFVLTTELFLNFVLGTRIHESIVFSEPWQENFGAFIFSLFVSLIISTLFVLFLGKTDRGMKFLKIFFLSFTFFTIFLFIFAQNFASEQNTLVRKFHKLQQMGCIGKVYFPRYLPNGFKYNGLTYISIFDPCSQKIYGYHFFHPNSTIVIYQSHLAYRESIDLNYASKETVEYEGRSMEIYKSKTRDYFIIDTVIGETAIRLDNSEGEPVTKEELLKVISSLEEFDKVFR